MDLTLDMFAQVPITDWFDLAEDQITRKIELELKDSNVYARVNLLVNEGDITPTHAHPFGHTTVCGRGKIGVAKIYPRGTAPQLTVLLPGMGTFIEEGIEHTFIALQANSGFVCLFPHRTPQGEIVQKWTGWPPGQGVPCDPNDWQRTAKTLYVTIIPFGEMMPGFVITLGQAPSNIPPRYFAEIEVPDAPIDGFCDLIDCHRGVFTKEPSKILPIRDRCLQLALCRPVMSYDEVLAAKRSVELLST